MRELNVTHRESTQIRRKQIITAAKKLILKHGSEHVTVRRMAREIGITESAIYRHFVSKNEILSFLLDDIEKKFTEKIVSYNQDNADALSILQSMLMNQISDIKDKRGISFQIIAEIISLGNKELNQKAHRVVQILIDQIHIVLSEGVKSGQINPDLQAVSILIFSMLQGLSTIWTLSRRSVDLEQKYQYLWNVIQESIIMNKMYTQSLPY
jgi:TetR/AcrR family transcriptional regulator, fatty acid metabolism regulator protein